MIQSITLKRNPFSTRWTKPGAIPFHLPPDQTWSDLMQRLENNQWCGQIVGPHGHGKTTFLRQFVPLMEAAGRRCHGITLRDHTCLLPELHDVNASQIIVDGYEQLSFRERWRLRRLCHRQQWGLLVTTHQPVWLPMLLEIRSTQTLVLELFQELTEGQASLLSEADVIQLYRQHRGDVRETWFSLYDLWETRRKGNSNSI